MTLEAKATVLWLFAVALAALVQVWPRSSSSMNEHVPRRLSGPLALSLASVAVALVAVGVASGTLRTHLVQISPLVLLLALLPRAREFVSAAAAGVLSWWLVTMVAIWLFLLGLSRFLTGTFSPTEIFLTIVIGIACLAGLSASGRGRTIPLMTRLAALVFAAALQSAALW